MPNNSFPNIQGSIPALITPMHPNGDIDYQSFEKLIDWHVEQHTDALVVVGTSGESPTVSVEEHIDLIKRAVEHCAGRLPIIAGVGGNSTKEAIHLHESAAAAGAQAGLSVCPYYNKPVQEGMYLHFKAIAEHSDMPLIIYNVPGRTVVNISNDTLLRLAELPGVMGVKDATGHIDRLGELMALKPAHFKVYSGDDPTAAALILLGGDGNISVTANIVPRMVHDLCVAAMAGDARTTSQLNNRLHALNSALFCESNPIPVKFALAQMGKCELGYRLPLTPPTEASKTTILKALSELDLI